MKKLLVIAVLLLLSATGFAQDNNDHFKKFIPIKKKELVLKYLGQERAPGLKQLKKPELSIRNLQKPAVASSTNRTTQNYSSTMPVAAPDSTIFFPILATKPDSAILYHMQVKRHD